MDLVIPDPGLSLHEGAVDPWTKPQYAWYSRGIQEVRARQGPLERPFCDLTRRRAGRSCTRASADFFAEVETKKYKVHVRVFLSRYRGYAAARIAAARACARRR